MKAIRCVYVDVDEMPHRDYVRPGGLIATEELLFVIHGSTTDVMTEDEVNHECLPVMINEELGTDKPSIGAEMVKQFIAKKEVLTIGEKTTLVKATLRNGFEIIETSTCVSAENYSQSYGEQICMKKIEDKVWMLLGFLLQTAVNGFDYEEGNKC